MATEDAILARLECSMCFELMTDPKQLSCTHTFCQNCLTHLYQSRRRTNELSCPTCRKNTQLQNGDVSKLQTNFPIKAMVGDLQGSRRICTVCDPEEKSIASVYCQACSEYLCEPCLEAHRKYRKNKNHEVNSTDDIKTGKVKVRRFCQKHPQEEKLWVCTTCNTSICFRCRMLDHNASHHDIVDVSEFQKQMKDQIKSLQKRAEEKLSALDKFEGLVKEQDAKIEVKTDEIIADINEAYDDSIQRLTIQRKELIRQCNDLKSKLKVQLRDCRESTTKTVDSIRCASELVSNGMKTLLEGDALTLHTVLSGELEDLLATREPNNSHPLEITKQAEEMGFTRYRGKRELDLGKVMRKTDWKLEMLEKYALSRTNAFDVHLTQDGNMAVGYCEGGIGIFTVDGPQKTLMNEVKVIRFCVLSDGCYVVRDGSHSLVKYTPIGERSSSQFVISLNKSTHSGLSADRYDNIFVCNHNGIVVFRPEGGAPIREIHCKEFEPFDVRHMKDNKLLVVRDMDFCVRVIDDMDEDGKTIYSFEKPGFDPRPAVLQDDTILVLWQKHCDKAITIDLFTPQLKYVRTVLADFKIEQTTYSLAEFPTGEIAFPDKNNLYVFLKTRST